MRGSSARVSARRTQTSGAESGLLFSVGRLKYDGTAEPITIDDATLAHLKIVIGTKLRRQESFMLTWRPIDGGQDARLTIWIHPAIPLQFGFDRPEFPQIDPARISAIMGSLNASGELHLDLLQDHLEQEAPIVRPNAENALA